MQQCCHLKVIVLMAEVNYSTCVLQLHISCNFCLSCVVKQGSLSVDDTSIGIEFIVGRLQIYYNYTFGYINQTDIWDDNDVEVVCRQLGYFTGGNYSVCPTCELSDCTEFTPAIWDVSINCNGNETHLLDCNSNKWRPYQCINSFKAAGVSCAGNYCCICFNTQHIYSYIQFSSFKQLSFCT